MNRRLSSWKRLLLLGLVFGALVASIAVSQAQNGLPAHPAGSQLAGLPARFWLADHRQPEAVRLIVGLNMVYVPETDLPNLSAALAQRLEIEAIQTAILEFLESIDAEVFDTLRYAALPYLALEIDTSLIEQLRDFPLVDGVFQDLLFKPTTSDANTVVGAPEAWARGYDGSGYVVAILDTGVDFGHPALAGKRVAEACFSTGSVFQGAQSACPNGQDTQYGTGAAHPYHCEDCQHGTHVAGIAAGDDGRDFQGVAPGAGIIGINVFSLFYDPFACEGAIPCAMSFTSDQLRGLDFVYSMRDNYDIAAVNLSLGNGRFYSACDSARDARPYVETVEYLRRSNIAVIAASGNEAFTDSMGRPACYSRVISVGATDNHDIVTEFTNDASFLDLYAPGSAIWSSLPGGGYGRMSGTSMAAPYVTGAWAIMRQAYPGASVDDILRLLQGTATLVHDSRNGLTHARIQLDDAVPSSLPMGQNPTAIALPTLTPTMPRSQTPTALPAQIDRTLVTYTQFLDALNGLVDLPISFTDIVYTVTGVDIYAEFQDIEGMVSLGVDETGTVDLYNLERVESGGLLGSVFAAGVNEFMGEILAQALADIIEARFGRGYQIIRVTASIEGLTLYVRR